MTLMLSPTPGISAFPDDEADLSHWTATLTGPSDTPYASKNFQLSFEFPSNYPFHPPTVLFKTPIYHPNIDFAGRICLDILKVSNALVALRNSWVGSICSSFFTAGSAKLLLRVLFSG